MQDGLFNLGRLRILARSRWLKDRAKEREKHGWPRVGFKARPGQRMEMDVPMPHLWSKRSLPVVTLFTRSEGFGEPLDAVVVFRAF